MSNNIPETGSPGSYHEPTEISTLRGEQQQQPDNDFGGKEFYSGVEINGATIPQMGHFCETLTSIAPEVINTNISQQDGNSVVVADELHTTGLAVKNKEQERGLNPRGIGTPSKGVSKAVRNTLVVILIFITIALVGFLVGFFLERRHSSSSFAMSQYDILRTSKLSALIFQNENNDTDKSVFFQLSSSLAIMRARWNSSTTGWTFENVSQAMIDGGSSIYPKAGTPLVAVAPDAVDTSDLSNFWVDLYFMSLDMPYQIWSWSVPQTDPSKDQLWHQESLQNYQVIFTTGFAKGTQLAAYRDQCAANCSDSTRLLYQGANSDLMLGNSSVRDWEEWNVTDLSRAREPMLPALEMNSSIAMTRYSPGPGIEPSGMKLYYDVSHRLEEYLLADGSWTIGSFQASLGGQVVPPDVSVVTYANETGESLDRTLLTILFDNGTAVVHWQEAVDGLWNMGIAPPTNMTALALTHDLKAYCLSGGQIQEWAIDGSNPASWTFIGNVTG
ncbi:hypothetical protein VM1G_07886 [Cytospora mali]|uniref:Fucose-specific lectin n=1 Tax=Cytospora mali TaxID=578113 RepID=A0A194W711_CYTMA|nr:hypothetical protein VM1G_07886 [Valsa mali]